MKNLIKVDFSSNNRSVLTCKQKLISSNSVLVISDINIERLVADRNKLLHMCVEAKENFRKMWQLYNDSLTHKQFLVVSKYSSYIDMCVAVYAVSKSKKLRDIAEKTIKAFDLKTDIAKELKDITYELERLNYWKVS